MPELRIKFDRHGLGDCVHFAHALQLYRRRGYAITVQVEENKLFVWKVAGVNIVQGGGLPDHPYLYPGAFEDLDAPDHDQNKVAFGLRHESMPPLAEIGLTPAQAWDELCNIRLSAHSEIPGEAHAEAERFLEGLPKPIVCLHSRGTNWHERKSLPTEVAFDVILKLLDQTAGSVVVLDYDERAPMVGSARCKGIKPAWGHIGIDRLCALFERADLMIGVDSGPFHVASLTGVKALGVHRSLHPCRVCLPNPNAIYLASRSLQSHWESRADRWNIETYAGLEPTATEIVAAAIKLLHCKTPKESRMTANSAGWYDYHRVGHDRRRLELRPDGTIGEGAAGCELRWFARPGEGTSSISIAGDYGVICTCTRDADGIFRGQWARFEKMSIELTPMTFGGVRTALRPAELSLSPVIDVSDGKLHVWTSDEAARVFPTYQKFWRHPVGSRGNGLIWLLDPAVQRSDLDACGIDHEDWMLKYLDVPANACVLDLASFIGTNAVRWAKANVDVIAVEPVPSNRDLLYRNLVLNQVADRVTVIPKAFGREVAVARMASAHFNSHFSADGDLHVEVTTIDHELLPSLSRLDLVKLDVEGAECEVIEGATETLKRFRPRLIIEVHSHMPGREANGTILAEQLQRLGYSHRQIWRNTPAYYYIEAVPAS